MNEELKESSVSDIKTFKSSEISDQELVSLTNAIKKKYGIDFTNYEKRSLKRGFARLITKRGMSSVLELWSKVLNDRVFFMSSIDDLTVNLTELFRNPEIWTKIKNSVLDEVSHSSSINIWHAGCSSGEEVYTMAIVLQDKGLLMKSKALATDLSKTILEKAKLGEYPKFLMNKYAKTYQEYDLGKDLFEHFEMSEDKGSVKNFLKRHVTFKRHNLIHDGVDQMYDIIFCRNVMIYFDDDLKTKIIQQFYDHLKPGGFFVIGYYDMIPKQAREIFDLYDSKTRIYRKQI